MHVDQARNNRATFEIDERRSAAARRRTARPRRSVRPRRPPSRRRAADRRWPRTRERSSMRCPWHSSQRLSAHRITHVLPRTPHSPPWVGGYPPPAANRSARMRQQVWIESTGSVREAEKFATSGRLVRGKPPTAALAQRNRTLVQVLPQPKPQSCHRLRAMRAVRFHEHGGREVLRLEEIPTPSLPTSEVLVRVALVRAEPLRHRPARELSRWPLELPWIARDRVRRTTLQRSGAGVEPRQEGQRVWVLHELHCEACSYCLAGDGQPLPRRRDVERPERRAATPSTSLAPRAAVLPASRSPFAPRRRGRRSSSPPPGTCWSSACRTSRGRDRARERGRQRRRPRGLQIAKLAGATVIATACSDEKLERRAEDGADHVVNYGTRGRRRRRARRYGRHAASTS